MRDTGSVLGERGQGVRGRGEVGNARLHVQWRMKASGESSGGGRRVFTWWGRLHIWHVCVQTEGPSNTPSAGAKFWSLDEGKINEDRCLVIQRNDHKQTVIKKKMKPLSKSFRKKCIIFYVTVYPKCIFHQATELFFPLESHFKDV